MGNIQQDGRRQAGHVWRLTDHLLVKKYPPYRLPNCGSAILYDAIA